ncbi:MAG: arsenosugar biosynthesis radical SAM protein ArsS [Coriobacteriales bacterium]|jgi:radical SAM/Cys-rich protein|nr:arsenosugar biosynthesis radical SAM protein ArsS [Coriobacteriales bacterium]
MPVTYKEFAESYLEFNIPPFADTLAKTDSVFGKTNGKLTTMQVNVGYACNFSCTHCFLESSPERTEIMSKQTMEDCLTVFAENGFETLDITGGAPELNPHLEWFIEEGVKLGKVMVRSNAALLTTPAYQHLIEVFRYNEVTVVVSLPCYTKENVDSQRGTDNFEKVIAGIEALNAVGYGTDPVLELNLVYNPLGGFLPGSQCGLEADYRRILGEEHNIAFNNLFCLANTPMGRFRTMLESKGELGEYLTLIYENYNPDTLPSMMCRNQLNVDYDGGLYDCEMNHVIGLPINDKYHRISDLKGHKLEQRDIRLNGGCYVCTAGSGSSCGGALV